MRHVKKRKYGLYARNSQPHEKIKTGKGKYIGKYKRQY